MSSSARSLQAALPHLKRVSQLLSQAPGGPDHATQLQQSVEAFAATVPGSEDAGRLQHTSAEVKCFARSLVEMAAQLPLVLRRLPRAPIGEQLAICEAGCMALMQALLLAGSAHFNLGQEQVLRIAKAESFLFGSWEHFTAAVAKAAISGRSGRLDGRALAAAAGNDLANIFACIDLLAQVLGKLPAPVPDWWAATSHLASKMALWLTPAMRTMVRCVEEAGDMYVLCTSCQHVLHLLDSAGQFSIELSRRLQADPAEQKQLLEALDRCTLLAAAACFGAPALSGGSRGGDDTRESGSASGGSYPVAARWPPAGPTALPEEALIAAMEARWSPFLPCPSADPGGSQPLSARAPALLNLAGQLLAAAPAQLPADGPQRRTGLRALLAICAFIGEAGGLCCNSQAGGVPLFDDPATLQPAVQAAVRLLPRLAAAWRLVLGNAVLSELSADMQAVEQALESAVFPTLGGIKPALKSVVNCSLLGAQLTDLPAVEHLSEWCAGTDAALRLVPALLQLSSTAEDAFVPLPFLPLLLLQQTAHLAAAAMGERGLHPGCGGCSSCAAAARRNSMPLTPAQGRSLQVLHSTACRAVHLLSTVPLSAPLGSATIACHPHTAAAAAFNVLLAARAAASAGQSQAEGQEPPLSSAALQSMAAVHLAALSASWAGATEPCTTVLRQLAVVASLGHPASSSPELLALVRHQLQLLRALPAGSAVPVHHLASLRSIANHLGAAATALAQDFPWERWMDTSVDAQDVAHVLNVAQSLSSRLVIAGCREARHATERSSQGAAVQQVWKLATRLHEDSQAFEPFRLDPNLQHLSVQQQQQIRRSAAWFLGRGARIQTAMAAALDALWQQQPERQQQVQVELARAAAGRPGCSYLRCAEVQGGKSKRCTGCRTARYCSTACQHADWRQGGHRQVCRLLAVPAAPPAAS